MTENTLFGKTCPDCGGISIYRREVEGVEDIKCGDCGAVFGDANLKRKSPIRKIQEAQKKIKEASKLPVVYLHRASLLGEGDDDSRNYEAEFDPDAKFNEPYIPFARVREALEQLDPLCEGKAIDALKGLLSDVEDL